MSEARGPHPHPLPEASTELIAGRRVSWLDFGGDGVPLLALHGTFGRGAIFAGLAARLTGRVRIIAPDQRGHGHSARAGDYGRDAFVEDAAAFLRRRGLGPVPVFGHSLGGVTAYQLAARHPELVSALVIEDVGPVMRRPEVEHPVLDVRGWPRGAASRAALGAAIEAAGAPDSGYFLQSAEPDADGGWRLLFDWTDMMAVQRGGVGDWWADWLASRVPALVLRGTESGLLPAGLARAMTELRPRTRKIEFQGAGHWIHDDDPDGVAAALARFLAAAPAA
ncbi:alpha/beta hydrolase [Streptomyces sp. AJS327]|uniref:alpha/beta fold hydrolase n=1 Tax=Streptomyces sp. AJS327 TaxID=2545265 RepID=UPI0015DF0BFB|nr:alpha/beta hydrolase [Streptomyces sp. AJS327]MBA0049886.1 alpha/beta hydrolase [Streptomyces sp. AJS327]